MLPITHKLLEIFKIVDRIGKERKSDVPVFECCLRVLPMCRTVNGILMLRMHACMHVCVHECMPAYMHECTAFIQ